MYKIVRMYAHPNRQTHTVRGQTGLTLEEAQAHCKDPETSSKTCTTREGLKRTEQCGAWFDGYQAE